MLRILAVALCCLISLLAKGQIRLNKLDLKPREIYELKESDILVVDSLIMRDSSVLILNRLKPANFIHAKVAVFYRGSLIDGKGVKGLPGRNGRGGAAAPSPCTDGKPGLIGSEGTNGGKGIDLSLYFSDIVVKGPVRIDVSGGDAGDGGKGGPGGDGAQGTRVCKGGNGAQGGMGANGGNGGDSGTVTFSSPSIPELRSMLGEKIIVRNYGGNHGIGGEGGTGGFSGLSPVGNTKLEGKSGKKGLKGKAGVQGKAGAINFQDK